MTIKDDVKKLIDMIIEGIDSLNHEKMKNKLLQHKKKDGQIFEIDK